MIALATGTLRKRIKDEQKAQRDYAGDISEAKRKGDKKSARTIGHIRGEEVDHERMLKSLWGQK